MGESVISIILGYIGWVLMSILKFVITPSLMIAAGYSWWEVIIVTTIGAVIGVLLFYNAGKAIFTWWSKFRANSKRQNTSNKKPKPTKGKRKFILFKDKYGLPGLILISGALSVPISAVLGAKYFRHNKKTPLYLIVAFMCWACFLTFVSWRVKEGVS